MSDHDSTAQLQNIRLKSKDSARFIVAVAGAPGAGKSTVVRQLAGPLDGAAVVEADGFHFDNAVLDQLGLRHRKGAPETFDVEGLALLLARLRRGEMAVAPVFDRGLDLARAGAIMLSPETNIIVVEGNYLALRDGPWAALAPLFDMVVYIDVPREELRRRLEQRWFDLGCSVSEVRQHVDENDLLNADLVQTASRVPDFILRSEKIAA